MIASTIAIVLITACNEVPRMEPPVDSERDEEVSAVSIQGQMVTIKGQGFGNKEQAAPVLWVMGDDVRENGVLETDYLNSIEGDVVPTGTGQIWTKGTGVEFQNDARHEGLNKSFVVKNYGWLGWPEAMGGNDTRYATQAYTAFRIKTWGDIENYKTVDFTSLNGQFDTGLNEYDEGEQITVNTVSGKLFSGYVVSVDTVDNVLHLSVIGINSALMSGASVIGTSSGAIATIPESPKVLNTVSGKYFRSYENANIGGGVKVVRSVNRFISTISDESGQEVDRQFELADKSDQGYGVEKVSNKNDWRLMETYMDLRGAEGTGYNDVDNMNKKPFNYLNMAYKDQDGGPTVSNIGWEAAGGTDGINAALSFGEVYFDSTPQRIVISDSATYFQTTSNIEYQYPIQWADNEVTFELNYGALDSGNPLYVYIFNENNEHNEKGFLLCNQC